MITPEQIEQLERFDGQGAAVLSVYLDLSPERRTGRAYRVAFKSLVDQLEDRLSEDAREGLRAEAARVQEWLDQTIPEGRGLALFTCTPRGLWQAHLLPVPVRDRVVYESTPYLAPLLDVLDEYERYAVVLVDKEKARLFSVFMGEIEERQEFQDLVPGKHEQGGWAQARLQRHHEAHVYWHLKRVAAALTDLFRRHPFDRLILAGPEEATSELRRLLPRSLAGRLVGTFPAEIFASPAEVLARTLEIERSVERAHEQRLLIELLDTAAAGGRAIAGLGPTLNALWLGEVQTLVVAQSATRPGSECPNCGRLEPAETGVCPACGTALRHVDDLVERAIERTLEQGGRVEVLHGEAARRLQAEGEGLGAFLRFR